VEEREARERGHDDFCLLEDDAGGGLSHRRQSREGKKGKRESLRRSHITYRRLRLRVLHLHLIRPSLHPCQDVCTYVCACMRVFLSNVLIAVYPCCRLSASLLPLFFSCLVVPRTAVFTPRRESVVHCCFLPLSLCFPVEAALHHPQRSIERPLFEHSPLFDAFFFLLKPPHGVVCCAGARGHGKEVPATRLHVVGPLQLLFTRCFIFLASFCLLRERFLWSFSSLSLSL
jgi:hypothetical protein